MTYPYQPDTYPPQPQYGQPPQYQQAPPQYAPQQPPAYGNGQYGAYQPQPQYAPPQQQAPPVPQGTIDDFYDQPSGGGKGISYTGKQPGWTISGIVPRPVTKADIQPQTDKNKNVGRWNDGRVKYQMLVPLNVAPSAEFPEGMATWYVKGQARDELNRAMAEAGRPPNTPPEAGARIDITFTGTRPIPGLTPQNLVQVRYTPPEHAANPTTPTPSATAPAPGTAPNMPAAPATAAPAPANGWDPQQQQAFPPGTFPQFTQPMQYAPQFAQPAPPVTQPQMPQEFQQVQPQNTAVQQTLPPPAQYVPNGQQMQPPAGLSPEHAQLLQQITQNQ